MEAGVIASWNKKIGDTVKRDVFADIETDKATLELESYKNGTLLYIGAEKGEKIPVNGFFCIIGDKDKVNIEEIVSAINGGVSAGITGKFRKARSNLCSSLAQTTFETTTDNIGNGRLKASPLAKKNSERKRC